MESLIRIIEWFTTGRHSWHLNRLHVLKVDSMWKVEVQATNHEDLVEGDWTGYNESLSVVADEVLKKLGTFEDADEGTSDSTFPEEEDKVRPLDHQREMFATTFKQTDGLWSWRCTCGVRGGNWDTQHIADQLGHDHVERIHRSPIDPGTEI